MGRVLPVSLALLGCLFVNVDAFSAYRLSGALERNVRDIGRFNNPQFNGQNNQFMNQQQQPGLNQSIRDSIGNIQKPTVNVNRDTGASSSSSISNTALVNRPTSLGQGSPSLKLGQGLAVAISIQGPEGAATNDTFSNTQMFNAGENDFGQSFANAGRVGQNTNAAQTGTNIHLQGNPNGFGTATSFNKANVNMFNAGGRGNGGRQGSAIAMGDVNGK